MLKKRLVALLPFVVTACLCVLGIRLGNWQAAKAEAKEAIAQKMLQQSAQPPRQIQEATELQEVAAFQRVKIRGHFLAKWPLYLDNRPVKGVAGFYVLMPFQIGAGEHYILVERGWVPRDPVSRTKLPALSTPAEEIEIEGVLRQSIDKSMRIGAQDAIVPGAILQNLDIEEFQKASHLNLFSLVLQQGSDNGDKLLRDWPQPSAGSEKNRGYAFQWYGLAVMSAVFFVLIGIRRGTKRKQ